MITARTVNATETWTACWPRGFSVGDNAIMESLEDPGLTGQLEREVILVRSVEHEGSS
jgi:hypothetical protein